GTTGATAVVVGTGDQAGDVLAKGYSEITQHYPRPGWVEHDANEIWSAVQASAREALRAAGVTARHVRAIGITNQRETLVLWDRRTLEPIAPAIVWQDRRTADDCRRLREAGYEQRVQETTGLVLDPYFTATKLAWATKHVEGSSQAALFGQACTSDGMAKNTYGTGSFVLMHTGGRRVASGSGILTTVAWRRGGRLSYALEGAIFATGAALQWLRDGLGIIANASEAGPLASSVPDTGGVFLVLAFVGLGAPHWDPYARGTIVGLTRGAGRAHIVRAAVESMAFQ